MGQPGGARDRPCVGYTSSNMVLGLHMYMYMHAACVCVNREENREGWTERLGQLEEGGNVWAAGKPRTADLLAHSA